MVAELVEIGDGRMGFAFGVHEHCASCARRYKVNLSVLPGRPDVIRRHRRLDLPERPVCAGSWRPPAGYVECLSCRGLTSGLLPYCGKCVEPISVKEMA
jgi:hypothetical protein